MSPPPAPTGRRSRRRGLRLPLAVAALALSLVAGALAGCAPPPAYSTTTVVSGLSNPWDIAFLPDGDFLFTERWGRINIYDSGTKRTLLDPPDSAAAGEAGVMGVAVDPAFATNRRVYTCFLSNLAGTPDIRLVRWRRERRQHRAHRAGRHRHRHPGQLRRPPLGVPPALRPRRLPVGRHR